MAVAAAIGVGGSDQEDVMSSRLANATSRLSGKRSLLRSSGICPPSLATSNSNVVSQQQRQRSQQQATQGLSEINRSIEKMTLQPMNNGESSSSSFSAASASNRDVQGMEF